MPIIFVIIVSYIRVRRRNKVIYPKISADDIALILQNECMQILDVDMQALSIVNKGISHMFGGKSKSNAEWISGTKGQLWIGNDRNCAIVSIDTRINTIREKTSINNIYKPVFYKNALFSMRPGTSKLTGYHIKIENLMAGKIGSSNGIQK